MEKIKSFVKEHKKEIGTAVVTGVVTVGCVILHKKVNTNFAKPVIKFEGRAKEFTEAIESVDRISKFKDFSWGSAWKISDLGMYGEKFLDLYGEHGMTADTVVHGVLVMTD